MENDDINEDIIRNLDRYFTVMGTYDIVDGVVNAYGTVKYVIASGNHAMSEGTHRCGL